MTTPLRAYLDEAAAFTAADWHPHAHRRPDPALERHLDRMLEATHDAAVTFHRVEQTFRDTWPDLPPHSGLFRTPPDPVDLVADIVARNLEARPDLLP